MTNDYYTIEYYNEAEARWRLTGSGAIHTIESARARMSAMADMCDHSVSFHIVKVAMPA